MSQVYYMGRGICCGKSTIVGQLCAQHSLQCYKLGDDLLAKADFEQIIESDAKASGNLFLVAVAEGAPVGFAQCAGSPLARLRH